MVRDPCAVLGVAADADDDTVRAAYLRLVRQTHPDLGGSEAQFREVCAAYEALSGVDGPFRFKNGDGGGGDGEGDAHDAGGGATSNRSVSEFLRKQGGMSGSEWRAQEEEHAQSFQEHLRAQRGFASRAAAAGRSGRLAPDPERESASEWEMGHGLGRFGTGPDSVYLRYADYYKEAAEAARSEERGSGGSSGSGGSGARGTGSHATEGKHEAFWRRRRERERKGLHSFARAGVGSGAGAGALWRTTAACALVLVRQRRGPLFLL